MDRRKTIPRLFFPLEDHPRVRVALRAPMNDRRFKVRYCGDTHALHLYDYSGRVRIGDRSFDINPGDMTVTPAHTVARYDVPRAGTHLVVHFQSGSAVPTAGAALPLHMHLEDHRAEAQVRVMRIIHMHTLSARSKLARASTSAALQDLLLWLALHDRVHPHAGGALADRAVETAVDLLDLQLARPLSIPEIAQQVGMSQNYLAKRFRERFGMTMQQYLGTRRIELARELLVATDLPIKLVGQRVGIPDPQYFNKYFRRLTGMSPSAVRVAG